MATVRHRASRDHEPEAQDHVHHQTLAEEDNAIRGESRMVLPGIQALFGFQLIAVFNDGFQTRLEEAHRIAHLVAIALIAIAVVLVLAPAAIQRQAEPHVVTREFVRRASRLLTAAMVALAAGLSIDFFVVAMVILRNPALAATCTAAIAAIAVAAWFVYPWLCRRARLAGRS